MNTVLTMGSFDLLHEAHLALFRTCRKLAGQYGRVVVAVNEDAFITRFKTAPFFTYPHRAALVAANENVNEVRPNDGHYQAGIIDEVNPDFLVVGDDWSPGGCGCPARKDYYAQLGISQEFLDDRNITLCYVPRHGAVSSTELRERLRDR